MVRPVLVALVAAPAALASSGCVADGPTCGSPETRALVERIAMGPVAGADAILPGLGSDVRFDLDDVVTVERTDRSARCRATLVGKSKSKGHSLSSSPVTYRVDLTDAGKLVVTDE